MALLENIFFEIDTTWSGNKLTQISIDADDIDILLSLTAHHIIEIYDFEQMVSFIL